MDKDYLKRGLQKSIRRRIRELSCERDMCRRMRLRRLLEAEQEKLQKLRRDE